MKVLIVDDDGDILKLLEDILLLKFPSIKLATAKNGVEALNLLKKEEKDLPHIVLSDMKMPVMNGTELCKMIKNKYKGIKVALMTAFNETSGCFDEIFFKPIDFDALFNFIKNNWE
ncbi:MAG: response regulator [Candidatus Sigynarchaeota archaeon]